MPDESRVVNRVANQQNHDAREGGANPEKANLWAIAKLKAVDKQSVIYDRLVKCKHSSWTEGQESATEGYSSMFHKWKRRVAVLLNEPNSSREASVISVCLVILIVTSVVIMVLATVDSMSDMDSFAYLEQIFAYLFTLELFIRCLVQYSFESPQIYFREMFGDIFFYIDALAVLPTYIDMIIDTSNDSDGLQILKALRVVRLFKLFRQFQGSITLAVAIEESIGALTVPFFFLVISATTFGVFVYYFENIGVKLQSGPGVEPTFHSIPHSIWFIFVTMTTVGYGDVSPVSALGRVVNVFAMVFGVLFLSMPIAILGNNFVLVWNERDRITFIARIKEDMMRGGVNKKSVDEAFAAIDTDGSGAVNRAEFYAAIRKLKIEMTPKALKKLWHSIDVDGSGEINAAEFVELLFPEVEGLDDDEDDHDGSGDQARGVVSDPVLMKLLMQEKALADLTARVAYLCEVLERVEMKVRGTDDVPHPPTLSQSSLKSGLVRREAGL